MLLLAHLIAVLLAAALSAADPIPVVTGSTVVHDLAVRIGGERVSAACLLRPGLDPHAYQPVPGDVRRLAAARLVVINGLGFEGWFEKLAREAAFAGTVVTASAGVPVLRMRSAGHGHHHDHDHAATAVDPHAFHAILNGVRYAENIRDALAAADPAGADGFRVRTAAVIDELRAADAWARARIAPIPRAQRRIITNHDALQYFAAAYGFEILAPRTALEDSEPSGKDLAELVAFVRSQEVKGVFLEFGRNQKAVEQIAAEAGVRIGGVLHLDGVGPADGPAATYVGMFRANVDAIVEALR